MDIDIIQRQLAELTRLVPTLVTRMDALERTIGAQQRQVSDLTNLAPQRAVPKQPESTAEAAPPKK